MSEQSRADLEQKIDEARESIRKAEVRVVSLSYYLWLVMAEVCTTGSCCSDGVIGELGHYRADFFLIV